MTISTNQNRHLYVASAVQNTKANVATTGDIYVEVINDGLEKELYFLYKGADTTLKSDRIQLKNLSYAKAISAEDMLSPLKSVKVTLNEAPVVGQDYVLRIDFRQFYGMGEEDQYFKDVAVHVTSDITDAKKFFDAMKSALNLAFSREVGATKDANPYLAFATGGSGAAGYLTITEKEQDWNLGTMAQERVLFDVNPTTILVNGVDTIWGTVEDITPTTDLVAGVNAIGNGKKIADLEYFCAGERGDIYRNVGWPNVIPTTYLVDPSKQYAVLELHHAFTDTGVNSYKSEKDITIVAEDPNVIDAIVEAINTKAGLQIAPVSGGSGSN